MSLDILVMLSVIVLVVVTAVWWRFCVGWDSKRLRDEWAKLTDHPPYM